MTDSSSVGNMKETHASSSEMEFIFFGNPPSGYSNKEMSVPFTRTEQSDFMLVSFF